MSMKSKLGMMGMFGALAIMGTENRHGMRECTELRETEEQRKHRVAKAEIKRYKAQGLSEFFYGENSLWALNQKSADKKARKRNWL